SDLVGRITRFESQLLPPFWHWPCFFQADAARGCDRRRSFRPGGDTEPRLMRNRHLLTILLALVALASIPGIAGLAIRKAPDSCEAAVRHYEAEDLPNGQIVHAFENLSQGGDIRGTMWLARLYFKGRCSLTARPDQAQAMAREALPKLTVLAEQD